MENKVLFGVNFSQYLLIALQIDNIFKYIQLGLAIICSIVLLAYRIWKWYEESKKDGKIDNEEIKQLIDENKDEVINVVDDIKELIDDIKEDKNK